MVTTMMKVTTMTTLFSTIPTAYKSTIFEATVGTVVGFQIATKQQPTDPKIHFGALTAGQMPRVGRGDFGIGPYP